MNSNEMKAPVKVALKDGRHGEIKATSKDGKHYLVEFYDGKNVDPTDPMFPMYTEVVSADDVTVVSG